MDKIEVKIEEYAKTISPELRALYEKYKTLRKSGVLIYKCRRCGKIFEKGHVPDIYLAIICLIAGGMLPDHCSDICRKETYHLCTDCQCQ